MSRTAGRLTLAGLVTSTTPRATSMSDTPLHDRFPDLQPVRKPGSLGSLNGFGTTLVGRRDHDPDTGTYVTPHCVSALFIPVAALGA